MIPRLLHLCLDKVISIARGDTDTASSQFKHFNKVLNTSKHCMKMASLVPQIFLWKPSLGGKQSYLPQLHWNKLHGASRTAHAQSPANVPQMEGLHKSLCSVQLL